MESKSSDLLAVWQVLADRRAGYDSLMWQTPALGMTAQAFLLTLALGADSSAWSRLIAAALSLTLSLMTMQLMAKHRRHEMFDSLLLERLEERLDLAELIGVRPHAGPGDRPRDDLAEVDRRMRSTTPGPQGFWRMSSYSLWMLGLALFCIASLAVLVLVASGTADAVLA